MLYKHIIQVENKNVGLKVGGGHKHTIAPLSKKWGGTCPPCPPASYASDVEWCVSGAKLGFFMLYAQIDYKFVKVHQKPNIYIIWSILFFLSPGRCTHVRTS